MPYYSHSIIISSILICISGRQHFFNGIRSFGSVRSPNSISPNDISRVTDKWIVQKLDNFNENDDRTWWNRYFVNDDYYVSGGPIFLMLRGEDTISRGFMVAGAWMNYAKKHNAICFQLEQRFYGDSLPTGDLSLENLVYLTSQQALGDAANLIQTMNEKYNFSPNQKWIIFGGSYAGALALWLVEQYPNLAYGSVSSSGPVQITMDFSGYLAIVSKRLALYSTECAEAISKTFSELNGLLLSNEGQHELDNKLNLCESSVDSTKYDVASLMFALAGDFMDAVQYNNINTADVFVNIKYVCDVMQNDSISSNVDKLAEINRSSLAEDRETCIEYKYDLMVYQLNNISIFAQTSYGSINEIISIDAKIYFRKFYLDRQWFYQTCNELGFFQTTDSHQQIFGTEIDLSYFINQCLDIFGNSFTVENIRSRLEITNLHFGGYYPHVKNVLSVQGSGDPWSLLGITRNNTYGVTALYIDGTAHCANMYDPSPNDSPQLTEARYEIEEYIGNLLSNSVSVNLLPVMEFSSSENSGINTISGSTEQESFSRQTDSSF